MLTSRQASAQLKSAAPIKSSCGPIRPAALRKFTTKCQAAQDVSRTQQGHAAQQVSADAAAVPKGEAHSTSRRWMIGSAMASMAFLSCPCCTTGVAQASEGGPAGWSYGEHMHPTSGMI